MFVQKMYSALNKMWITIGLPVLLVVIAVQCIETELGREAAFQGKFVHKLVLLAFIPYSFNFRKEKNNETNIRHTYIFKQHHVHVVWLK